MNFDIENDNSFRRKVGKILKMELKLLHHIIIYWNSKILKRKFIAYKKLVKTKQMSF